VGRLPLADKSNTHRATAEQFMELYGKHQIRLIHYITPLVPSLTDAEDVLQEVSKALWEKFGEFEPGTNFLAWARRIAYLRVLEFRRASQRGPALLPDDVLELVAEAADALSQRSDERLSALEDCFRNLGDSDRDLILQRYAPDMTGVKLATEVGRPVDSVYKSLGRIRRSLMECINRRMTDDDRK